MRINTNIAALNTQRILGQTNKEVAQQIGRLSSGLRINKAADDAAGLGIANKLRADIRGMNQASRNAEQANSLLQVAEGATQTISNIVDRMKELAVQSASDNVSDTNRAQIDAEFTELKSEMDRIVSTTKFGGSTLIDGTFGNEVDAGSSLLGTAGVSASTITLDGAAGGTYALSATGTTVTLTNTGTGDAQTIGGVTVDGAQGAQTWNFDQFGIEIGTTNLATTDTGNVVVTSGTVSFMVSVSGQHGTGGAAGNDDVSLASLDLSRVASLGIDGSLDTKANAQAQLTAIDSAITKISSQFGKIGAAQNRLEYATSNVKTSIENFQAAESTIRDADMAAEMTELSRVQILQQAGTAMLAQANQAPQSVLQLLR